VATSSPAPARHRWYIAVLLNPGWLTAVLFYLVYLLAACGGRVTRDPVPDAADAAGFAGAAGGGAASGGVGAAGRAGRGTCGDRIVTVPEQCDGADPVGVTCVDLGFDLGAVRCSSHCSWDGARCAYSFTSVDAGGNHTCGVRTDGPVLCWGLDHDGQATPPACTFSQVSVGGARTCGLQTDGTVVCWGASVR
jgi:hypothetical protein